jgi:cytochrome bd-type quinol oxidase subunit 2
MFKKLTFLTLFFLCFLIPCHADALNLGTDLVESARKEAGLKKATETTFAETLGFIIKTALSLVGIIFTALMVYAGYLWMTARGESDQIEKAKEIIKGSIIGIVITLGAYSITAFVVNKIVSKVSEPPSASQPQ